MEEPILEKEAAENEQGKLGECILGKEENQAMETTMEIEDVVKSFVSIRLRAFQQ